MDDQACTGKPEIPLTENGVKQAQGTREVLVGKLKLIDPTKFGHVFCSPRIRAQSTFNMLLGDEPRDVLIKDGRVTVTEGVAEWAYGDYEVLVPKDIRAQWKKQGLDIEKLWDIWVNGCAGGE